MVKTTILRNARIYTGDARQPWARSLAMVKERIVGLDAQADVWANAPGARVEDLGGALMMPGLTDAHIHFMWYALSLQKLQLRDVSRADMLAQVAERAAVVPPGTWISGHGWDQNTWEEARFPSAAELDRVAPRHPVALIAKSGHAWVVNSAAMQAAHITPDTPNPWGGKLGRDARGRPNGMFFEHAAALIEQVIPDPTLDEVVEALDVAQTHLLAAGITGVHDVDGAPFRNGVSAFTALQELRRQRRQRVRAVKYVQLNELDAVLDAGLCSGWGDDWLLLGGLKLFADGALGSRTGAMLAPYLGEADNVGMLTLEPERLRSLARQAVSAGLALAIHAIGDRANRLVLDVLAEVLPLNPQLRHRIEHVQHIARADQPRLGQLGIVASMQPTHAIHDMAMVERYLGARAAEAYPWRAVQDAGAVLAFGSDCPIEVFDPFLGLYAAVTRCREDGTPGAEGWFPAQRLSLVDAVRAYTWGAAYAAGQETRLGMLTPGYHADLMVLDRNIFALPPEALLETQVQRVMVNGEW